MRFEVGGCLICRGEEVQFGELCDVMEVLETNKW
jgi:hypothetical protein